MSDNEKDSVARGLARIHSVISRSINVAGERSHAHANGEPADPAVAAGFVG